MPRLRSEENKRNRVVDSEAIFTLFRHNPDEFLRRYITVDETWLHHYTPATKEKSKQWVFDVYFEDLPKSYFLDDLRKFKKRMEKCIEIKGDYAGK